MKITDMPPGATPLSYEDLEGLKPSLSTRKELDAHEQLNIALAERWALSSRKLKNDLLEQDSLQLLHKKMFDKTWRWAGKLRLIQTNIGVEGYLISTELRKLRDDVRWWIENKTFPPEEICVRFHHRLVWIHPFPNGNGRHARLTADLLLNILIGKRLTWGGNQLSNQSQMRAEYIQSLKKADKGDFESIILFATG